MTAPTVVDTTTYVTATPQTSWATVTSLSVNRGSIVVVSANNSATTLSTASVGWAKLNQLADGGSPSAASAIFYKTVTGTNDLVIASSASTEMSAILLRISANGGAVVADGVLDDTDCPSITLPGTYDALFVVALTQSVDTGANPPGTYSLANYTRTTGVQPSTHLCYRTATASSENPNRWAASDENVVWTLGLYVARRGPRSCSII